jgi:hypothetical protein
MNRIHFDISSQTAGDNIQKLSEAKEANYSESRNEEFGRFYS